MAKQSNAKYKCSYDKLVDIDQLVENPRNPNKHPDKQIDMLSKIIDFQGQRSPYILDKKLDKQFNWIPFNKIPDNAKMYKGKKRNEHESNAD